MLNYPLPLTWKRLWAICRSRHSLLRFLEYELLQGTQLTGDVLDAGGEKNSRKSYQPLFHGYNSWTVLNISKAGKPDVIADMNKPLPFADASFDSVICMNTLEHVQNITLALSEMIRVLRPGGKIIISVPFLFPLHADPDDFHRPTASWWLAGFAANGIAAEATKLTPLMWCRFSSGMSFVDNSLSQFGRRLFRPFMLLPGLLRAITKKHMAKPNAPLGYLIMAEKY